MKIETEWNLKLKFQSLVPSQLHILEKTEYTQSGELIIVSGCKYFPPSQQ